MAVCVVALFTAQSSFAFCLVFIPGDPVSDDKEGTSLSILLESIKDRVSVD